MGMIVHMSPSCGVTNELPLTHQELLSPGQKKPSATTNTPQRDETVAPVSLKEFALENFR